MAKNFKIQPEDKIDFDEENEKIIDQRTRQHIELKQEDIIDFSRLDWKNTLTAQVTAGEV